MSLHYPDTSFLCASYRTQEQSPEADAFRQGMDGPLYFTSLLEFEFRQAIELQVWLHGNDRTRGYSRGEADRMIADWESDVALGLNRLLPFDMDAVLRLSFVYSQQRTAHGGHRSLDIFHVATAVQVGATHFLSFDGRQRDLARHAGLAVPL
ncbi:MAG: type II toxin-antitoxin system VapC family toxin [Verrucomicrobiaceae bacterium]|nr:type II toxin-antitoxin system VapC family toxin [Verrucomicrobiaceae bacterium]